MLDKSETVFMEVLLMYMSTVTTCVWQYSANCSDTDLNTSAFSKEYSLTMLHYLPWILALKGQQMSSYYMLHTYTHAWTLSSCEDVNRNSPEKGNRICFIGKTQPPIKRTFIITFCFNFNCHSYSNVKWSKNIQYIIIACCHY